jgi:hypothetical protein
VRTRGCGSGSTPGFGRHRDAGGNAGPENAGDTELPRTRMVRGTHGSGDAGTRGNLDPRMWRTRRTRTSRRRGGFGETPEILRTRMVRGTRGSRRRGGRLRAGDHQNLGGQGDREDTETPGVREGAGLGGAESGGRGVRGTRKVWGSRDAEGVGIGAREGCWGSRGRRDPERPGPEGQTTGRVRSTASALRGPARLTDTQPGQRPRHRRTRGMRTTDMRSDGEAVRRRSEGGCGAAMEGRRGDGDALRRWKEGVAV